MTVMFCESTPNALFGIWREGTPIPDYQSVQSRFGDRSYKKKPMLECAINRQLNASVMITKVMLT